MKIRVFFEPALLTPNTLADSAVIVIDVLRMTSVAVTAIANGLRALLAVDSIEEARHIARQSGAMLGGERNALPIDGFDLGNSPLSYTKERIGGRRLVMTTTNGTRAILAASEAPVVMLGAFVNAQAIAQALKNHNDAAFVCAGTCRAFTLEDSLAAGAMIERLCRDSACTLDDAAQAALTLYESAKTGLHTALAGTTHYGRLAALGLRDDLTHCLTEDMFDIVPMRGEDGWFA